MPALSAYSNTENTALNIIVTLGFRYWLDKNAYCCEKDGWDFRANSFTELLGVIKIFEHLKPTEYKEYWWQINEPWLLNKIPEIAPQFNPVYKKQPTKQS